MVNKIEERDLGEWLIGAHAKNIGTLTFQLEQHKTRLEKDA